MLKQILIALDQLLNTLLFWLPGGCWADETLSARAWRCRNTKPFDKIQPVIDRLFFDPSHCLDSYLSERRRFQLPPEYRH